MSGFGEIQEIAADLSTAATTAQVRAVGVVTRTAKALEVTAKRLCRRDTGRLQRSITTSLSATDVAAEVGPEEYYGQFLEYGTSKMSPHPFMGPAADQVAPGFAIAMEELGADLL